MKYIVIISLALSIMTYQLNFTHFARGLSMIIIWCACIQGIHESSIELIRYGYPEKWCEKADKHRWLYGWGLRHQAKIIPGELMLCGFILSIWCFLSLLGLIVGWMMPDVFKGMDYIHTLGSVIIFFFFDIKAFLRMFRKKYKRLSWCNIKFIFGKQRRAPEQTKLGKCTIVMVKKRGKIYCTVRNKKTGKLYNRVLYCGENSLDTEKEYTLYDICNVKYIV